MTIADIVIISIIAILVVLAVISIHRQRKNGGSCCGQCSGCTMSGRCEKRRRNPDQNDNNE